MSGSGSDCGHSLTTRTEARLPRVPTAVTVYDTQPENRKPPYETVNSPEAFAVAAFWCAAWTKSATLTRSPGLKCAPYTVSGASFVTRSDGFSAAGRDTPGSVSA